jgi:levansucrase
MTTSIHTVRGPRLHTSAWTQAQIAGIAPSPTTTIPLVTAKDLRRLGADLDVWDVWPLQDEHGRAVDFQFGRLWMGLVAPVMGDPALRHAHARIWLLKEHGGLFEALGPAMPDGFSPGACEWSGSALLRADGCTVELHFTATGERATGFSHAQRLFCATARLEILDDTIGLKDWSPAIETVVADTAWQVVADGVDPAQGFIKAMRDPAIFQDPQDGRRYLTFAATLASGPPLFGGAIGVAVETSDGAWSNLGPLVRSDGLNHELERPHIVYALGRYYLFWCSQGRMFAPLRHAGPTGLYGMCADHILGPYRPINGTTLVAANPLSEPAQTYAWWVDADLDVWGFVDQWGTQGRTPAELAADPRKTFGGSIAPKLSLALDGDLSRII